VNTEATVPAVTDFLGELERMRDERVADEELAAARDFLVGVFPLRFETPGAVVGALAGLVVHELPDDELARYRGEIEAVTVDDVAKAAANHLQLERAAIVLVGDADAFGADLEAARFGPLRVERDEGPVTEGPLRGVDKELGPVDRDEPGPTSPADEPAPEGLPDPAEDPAAREGVDDR
jgi:hypothetical protein